MCGECTKPKQPNIKCDIDDIDNIVASLMDDVARINEYGVDGVELMRTLKSTISGLIFHKLELIGKLHPSPKTPNTPLPTLDFDKLVAESDDLSDKIAKISKALPIIPLSSRKVLKQQQNAMVEYLGILEFRINDIKNGE